MEFGYKFKSALFGFSKRDVMRCIGELNAAHEEALSELREQCQAAEQNGSDLSGRLQAAHEALLELKRQLRGQEKKSAALETVVKRLVDNRADNESEISQLKQRVAAINNKAGELQLKNNELARKLSEANEKVEKYDALTQDISEVMLEAQQMSARLREDAHEEAAQIVDGARQSAARARSDMDLFQRRIGQISHSLEQLVQNLQKEIGRIEESFTELNDGLDQLKTPEAEMPQREITGTKPPESPKAVRKPPLETAGRKNSGVTDFFGKFREWLQ